jgi:thiamine-phosphate pyrophosphorylase
MLKTAKKLRKLCDDFEATFIVNDRVDIALASNADGVHVGQEDMPAEDVRKIFDGIVGVSVNNVDEALKAEKHADYLGVGPVFITKTKENARKVTGIEGLARIVKAVSIPVVGIGSINLKNVLSVLETGVDGVAVISAIATSREPENEAKKLLETVRKYKETKDKFVSKAE